MYTCPGGTATTIIGMNLANKTSSAITADVTLLNNGGDSCYLVKDAPIPIGSSLVAVGGDQKVVLEAADTITAWSSVASSADAIVSYLVDAN